MLDKFWESLGEDLAGEWLKYVFSPAFLFWTGGMGIYILKNGWEASWKWLSTLQLIQQTALLIVALLILILSSLLMKKLRFTILRLMEGYWPWPLGWLTNLFISLQYWLFERREKKWNALKTMEKSLPRAKARQLAKLEVSTHYFPSAPKDVQPTAFGNCLRAAETIPTHKYGLDAYACWPRLWSLLPDNPREDLSIARQELMALVELWAWGVLFLVWTIWSPWALLVAGLWLLLTHAMLLRAAMAYADLFETAFDLYRWELYKAAHWPLPETSEVEIAVGKQLTEFIWRGLTEKPINYRSEEKEKLICPIANLK